MLAVIAVIVSAVVVLGLLTVSVCPALVVVSKLAGEGEAGGAKADRSDAFAAGSGQRDLNGYVPDASISVQNLRVRGVRRRGGRRECRADRASSPGRERRRARASRSCRKIRRIRACVVAEASG